MWSTEAMLAFVIFVFFSQLNVLQFAVGASVTPVASNPPTASPTVPQTSAVGILPTGSLVEATSRLANAFVDIAQRFAHNKKNSFVLGLQMVANTLNNTSQLGFGGTRPDQAQTGAPNPPSAAPAQTPSSPPAQPALTQPPGVQTPPAPAIPPAQPGAQ